MYATHRHDLFYITVKFHQNIPNGIPVIEQTRKCLRTDVQMDGQTDGRVDARLITISPEPFGRGIKSFTLSFSRLICKVCVIEEIQPEAEVLVRAMPDEVGGAL